MALNSDSLGFLTGSGIDTSSDKSNAGILRSIKGDTAAIRAAVVSSRSFQTKLINEVKSANDSGKANANKITEELRKSISGSGGQSFATRKRAQKESVNESRKAKDEKAESIKMEFDAQKNVVRKETPKKTESSAVDDGNGRDEKGRFTKGGDSSEGENAKAKDKVLLGDVAEKIGDKLKDGLDETLSDVDKVDPVVEAVKELKLDMIGKFGLSAIKKGFGALTKPVFASFRLVGGTKDKSVKLLGDIKKSLSQSLKRDKTAQAQSTNTDKKKEKTVTARDKREKKVFTGIQASSAKITSNKSSVVPASTKNKRGQFLASEERKTMANKLAGAIGIKKERKKPRAFVSTTRDVDEKTTLLRKILGKLSGRTASKAGGGGGAGGMLMGVLGGLGTMILGLLSKALSPIGSLLGTVFSGLGRGLMGLFSNIIMPVGRMLLSGLGSVGKTLFSVLRSVFLPVAGVLMAGFAGWTIGTWLYEKYGKQIQDALESITEGASGAWSWITDSWNQTIALATDAFQLISDTWGSVVGFFKDKLGIAEKKVDQVINDVGAGIKEGIMSAKSFLGMSNDNVNADGQASMLMAANSAGMGDKEKAMFMATMEHESGGFKSTSENMNYSSAKRIKSVFKGNKALSKLSDDQIQGLVNNPKALANVVYGDRMGNKGGDDGYNFRARGYAQLTGRSNYEAASRDLGIDFANNPKLAELPQNQQKLALWAWKNTGAQAEAKKGDLAGMRRKYNGGENGLAEVERLTQKYASMNLPNLSPNMPLPVDKNMVSAVSGIKENSNIITPIAGKGMLKSAATPLAKVPSAPELVTPVASSNTTKEVRTIVQTPNVGQNISDRAIAQLVTGGIGMVN